MFKFSGEIESIEIATAKENYFGRPEETNRIISTYANLGIFYSVVLDQPIQSAKGLIERVYVLDNLVARHNLRHGQKISGEAKDGKYYDKVVSISTRRLRAGGCVY